MVDCGIFTSIYLKNHINLVVQQALLVAFTFKVAISYSGQD
jgi:hypothetical protein